MPHKLATKFYYHAAPISALEDILKKGLLPRGETGSLGSVKYQNLSNPNMVYLTTSEYVADAFGRELGESVIFRVRLTSPNNLYPDEAALTLIFDKYPNNKLVDRFRYLEAPLTDMLNRGLTTFPINVIKPVWAMQEAMRPFWKDSLQGDMEAVCYKGRLPVKYLASYKAGNGDWVPLGKDVLPYANKRFALGLIEQLLQGATAEELEQKYQDRDSAYTISLLLPMLANLSHDQLKTAYARIMATVRGGSVSQKDVLKVVVKLSKLGHVDQALTLVQGLSVRQAAKSLILTTLGEGPPYKVVGIDSEKMGTIERVLPCDHCGTMLRAKQVHIEDSEGQEFLIGSACAKKIGGARLVKWVKEVEETQALDAIKQTMKLNQARLEAIPYYQIADVFPYGKWSFRHISKQQAFYRNRGLKKTAYTWAWDMLRTRLGPKEVVEFARVVADPDGYVR